MNSDLKFWLNVAAMLALISGCYMLAEKHNKIFYKKYKTKGCTWVLASVTAVFEFLAWYFHFAGGAWFTLFLIAALVCVAVSLAVGVLRAKKAGATAADVALNAVCQAVASLGAIPAMLVLVDIKPRMRRPER